MGSTDLLPFLMMAMVQLSFGGLTIISKLALDSGMQTFVFVAYRQIFATIAIAPLAFFMERKTRPRITLNILLEIFFCSTFGITVFQISYFVGLKNSTPTIGGALISITPAVTFVLGVLVRLEKLKVKSKAGQAKILGTIICIVGTFTLTFYQGPISSWKSSIHWKFAEKTGTTSSINHVNLLLGPFLLIVAAVSWSVYLILQTRLSQKYEAPYSSSTLMCLMASIQCGIVGFGFNPNLSAWSLNSSIRIISTVYGGIVCSALAFCAISWCVKRKGPLYVSIFSPSLLVIVAIVSWALLDENLHAGKVAGSICIILGVYGVLWGKKRELKMSSIDDHIDEAAVEGNTKSMDKIIIEEDL